MNEITKIHLGRQAFTIAVDAHKELQEYLRAIKRHMGDTDEAVEEVELRMAELLVERGVVGDKVVLPKDVDYLKQQLGEPGDFGDEDEAPKERESQPVSKRLFRDTDDAMVAGVASGIGKYLGIDSFWIRLAFLALIFSGGAGIVIYVILWLIVPEAKTSSDRLQMQGRPVTVDALKKVVEQADIEGTAERAGRTVGKLVSLTAKIVGGILGVMLIVVGSLAVMVLLAMATYLISHGVAVNNQLVFPVGTQETLVVVLAAIFGVIASAVLVFWGIAMVNKRQALPAWLAWILLVLFVGAGSIGTALAFDVVPQVSDRIDQTEMRMEGEVCKENIFSRCSYWRLPSGSDQPVGVREE